MVLVHITSVLYDIIFLKNVSLISNFSFCVILLSIFNIINPILTFPILHILCFLSNFILVLDFFSTFYLDGMDEFSHLYFDFCYFSFHFLSFVFLLLFSPLHVSVGLWNVDFLLESLVFAQVPFKIILHITSNLPSKHPVTLLYESGFSLDKPFPVPISWVGRFSYVFS